MGDKVPLKELAQKGTRAGTGTLVKTDNRIISMDSVEADKLDTLNFDDVSLAAVKKGVFSFC